VIDIDEIRKHVAIKHNVLIGKDDPVLVTVTINELVLSRYLDLANKHNKSGNEELILALHKQQEQSKEIASRMITEAAKYVSNEVRSTFDDVIKNAINEVGVQLQRQIIDAQALGRNAVESSLSAQSAKNGAMLAVILAGVLTILSAVFLGITFFHAS